ATTSSRSGSVTISCGKESVTVNLTEEAYSVSTASTTALTPEQVFNAMGPGWNMGNHMDAVSNGVSGETIWGNAKCTQATFDNVKKAGFKAVRICTTWTGHIGEAPAYRLEDKWLERVAEIVGYAEKAGLVAIVNTHHDETYWLDISKAYNNNTQNEKVKDEIFCVWTQIARRFADKGEWLVFESFNEIQDGGWGWSAAFQANPDVQYKVLNDWNQMFVNAVRGAGGNNATRWLGIPGYAASPGFTITGLVLPKDYTNANRLMVAVHDYDPYNYTLNTPLVRQWGHTADKDKRCSDYDEEGVVAVFDNLKKAYLDKNIPVYLGEMGCSRHADEDFAYQQYYMEYFCKAAADRLLPMYLWDNGATGVGPEKHGYFDHGTGAFVDAKAENLIGIMVKAVTTKDPAYTLESVYDSAP
ncbi:MAG: glycoside hydrolase family 5 protein, partial [Bacteroidales bacterium]|nr:glycoside hydrolase family 5 protein [Bacteroidales bacterium]